MMTTDLVTTRRDYAAYVVAWHQIDGAVRWLKGDLLAELVTSYGDKTLARFAADVGENENTLQALRAVALAYPQKSRRIDVRWTVYQVLASQPDRAEIVAHWSGTVADARKLVRERKRWHPPAPDPDPEPGPAERHQDEPEDARDDQDGQAAEDPEEALQDAPGNGEGDRQTCAHDQSAYLMVMCDECSFAEEINDLEPKVLAGLLRQYDRHEELWRVMTDESY